MSTARASASFRDRTVLVTGASSGIGRETALAFAAAGANLVLVARRAKALASVAAQARKLGVAALVATADVTQPEAVTACFRKGVKRFGTVDVVVNNAGVLIPAKVVDLRGADLQRMLDVNLFGALHVMQEAVKVMRKQGRGHIVNVGSLAGRRGFSPLGGYCATKFALVGLTEALRTELVGERIHVSLVLPAVVDTPMAAAIQHDPASADVWPEALTMPPSWVIWSIFLAIRFRLAEIAVPPGSALIEKLAALAPGTTDALLRRVTDAARKMQSRRGAAK
jgi:NAD(P)-dependent dehydrogenase (short-subunit alcohol dehydrogenase family)